MKHPINHVVTRQEGIEDRRLFIIELTAKGKPLALRAGYYLDPAPAPDETVNIIFPSIDYNAVTVGASYCLGQVMLDFGFEYLMGSDREIAQSALGNMPGTHGMDIWAASLGLSYSFK